MSPNARAGALALLFASACAHEPAPNRVAIARGEDDPSPARVVPTEHAMADGPVGLTIANDAVRARALVAALLDALGRADVNGAIDLLDDPIARTLPRIGPRAQSAQLVIRALTIGTQPTTQGNAPRIGRVRTLPEVLEGQPLPDGLAETDLVVEVDLTGSGVAPRIPSQSGISSFIVRPGPPARVIGL